MKKIFPIIIFLLLISFLFPISVEAALVPCATEEHPEPCTLCHLIVGIKGIIDYGTSILVVVALAAIVIAGVIYIASAGSPKIMQQAKSFLLSVVIGCVFFLAAWLIISVTLNIIGARQDIQTGWNKFSCEKDSGYW